MSRPGESETRQPEMRGIPLQRQPGILEETFVYTQAPFAQCHASTIVESGEALVAAWFGGTREKHPDVGIWVSRRGSRGWSEPVEVANGMQEDGTRHPCWNPVLFQPETGPLLLFYKVGPDPRTWWGMVKTSADRGETWSAPRRLPEGILGPIKNKPVQLPGGDLLSPSSTEDNGWRVHLERSSDPGRTWQRVSLPKGGEQLDAIQPSILAHGGGCLQLLCRSKQGWIVQSWSSDGGRTWSEMAVTSLPNPNSGTDAATLADGRHLLVYNHSTVQAGQWGGPRTPLNVAVSEDGKTWKAALVLEAGEGEYSYPAVIQSANGLVHVTYTWKRLRIKHVVIDPARLRPVAMAGDRWPKGLLDSRRSSFPEDQDRVPPPCARRQ